MRNQWKILIAFFVAMGMALAMGLSPAAADLVDDPVPEPMPTGTSAYNDYEAASTAAVYDVRTGSTITSPMCAVRFTVPPSTTIRSYYIKHQVVWQSAKTTANNTPVHRKLKEYITIIDINGNPIDVGNVLRTNVKVDGVSKSKGRVAGWVPSAWPLVNPSGPNGYQYSSQYWSGLSLASTFGNGQGAMTDWFLRTRQIRAQLWVVVSHPAIHVVAASRVPYSWPNEADEGGSGNVADYVGHGGCYSQVDSPVNLW